MTSVVIPAHNEEAVLGRCLSTLLADADEDEFDVVVVPNACTDNTAAVARQYGVRVIETPYGGKAHALRLGDDACLRCKKMSLKVGNSSVTLTRRDGRVRLHGEQLQAKADATLEQHCEM